MAEGSLYLDTERHSSQNSYDEPSSFNSTSADSYQPIHSLLLCPAQWTALLESPISLVREQDLPYRSPGLTTEECRPDNEERREEIEDRQEKCDNTQGDNVPLPREGDDDHNDDEKEEKEEEVDMNECQIAAQMKEEDEDDLLEAGSSDHLMLPLPQPGSLLTSDDSSDTTCVMDQRGDLGTHESLVAPTTCDSDQGSAPHTPLSESRLPLSYLATNHTHSRNISETPSLPPYISSSTSSAYHSRNSSMASQITSDCFDSDSQFTDIDSCIVLQSGGVVRGVADRPVSLQDGRYKFPDVPSDEVVGCSRRGCYSVCDVSPGKVRIPDHIVVTSPLALEDTLRQASATGVSCNDRQLVCPPDESFEVKHEASALKSSEWIKRVMSGTSRQSMVHVKVSSKTKHVVHFNVRAGDRFIWEFATKRKDIGLGLSFEATEVATVESPEPTTDEPPQKKMTSILPIFRVNSHTHPVIGSHTATQDGVYEIIFDNSYSRFFAKELFYRITTQPSQPNENYLNQ